MLHVEAFRDVLFHGLELRGSCCELAEGPGRMRAHLEDVACSHAWRNGKTILNLLRTVGKSRCVSEDDEGAATGCPCALKQLVAQLVFGWMVELEPKIAICDLSDVLDTGGGYRR